MRLDDEIGEALYMAGERVPPGMYKHVDSPYTLKLDGEDALPARLDGNVTCYVRLHEWREGRTPEIATQAPLKEMVREALEADPQVNAKAPIQAPEIQR